MIRDADIGRNRGLDSALLGSAAGGAPFKLAPAISQTRSRTDIRSILSMPPEEDDTMHALLKLLSRRPGLIAPYRGVLQALDRLPLGPHSEARLEALLEFAVEADEQLKQFVASLSKSEQNSSRDKDIATEKHKQSSSASSAAQRRGAASR